MFTPEDQHILDLLLKKRESNFNPTPTEKWIKFTNWTDEDFTHTWGKVPYTVKAGQTVDMQDWLAKHLAKHLAERELNNENNTRKKGAKEIDIVFTPKREEYIKKCLGEIPQVVAEGANAEQAAFNSKNTEKFEGLDEVINKS